MGSDYAKRKKMEREAAQASQNQLRNVNGQTYDEWKAGKQATSTQEPAIRNAFGQTYDEYKKIKENGEKPSNKLETWKSESQSLIKSYDDYSYSGKYQTQDEHDDFYDQISKRLVEATSLRGKYKDNAKEIDEIVAELSMAIKDNEEGRNYYSQWEDDETYQQFLKYQSESEMMKDFLKNTENAELPQDFEKNSQYVKPTGLKSVFRDQNYEYINDTEWSPKYLGDGNGDVSAQEKKGYDYITEDERRKYNYLYNTQGKDKAKEYLEELNLTERMANDVLEDKRAYAKEHPVLASVESVVKNVAGGGIGFAESAVNKLTGKEIDPNSYANLINRTSNEMRESVTEGIDSGVGQLLYQTGMSMADSVAAMAATAWTGPLGLAPGAAAGFILGSNAATSAMLDAKERGVSDGQALATGIAQGAAEMIFEKYSIGELSAFKDLPMDSLKSVVKNVLKQAGVEGSEEVFTSIANSFTDLIINGDLATNELNIQNYVNQGYTREEASIMGAKDQLKGLFMDFLGGAISGGVMGGGASVVNYALNRNANNTETPVHEETEIHEENPETVENETNIVENGTILEETIQTEEIPWEEATMYEGEKVENTEIAPAQQIEEELPAEPVKNESKQVQYARNAVNTVLEYGEVDDETAMNIVRNKNLRTAFEEKVNVKLDGTEEQQKNGVKELTRLYGERNGSTVQSKNTTVTPTVRPNATVKGKDVEIIGVKEINGSNPKFEASDGKIYATEEVSFSENTNKKLYSDAAKMAVTAGKDTANAMITNYKPEYNIAAYSWGFDALYRMGRNGVTLDAALKTADYAVSSTSENAMKKAWELGFEAKEMEDSKVTVEKKQQTRKGKGTFEDETRQGGAVAEIARLVADRTGIDIVRKAGMDSNQNAAFIPSTMTMLLSENAENEYTSMIHELGEFGLSYNRADMKQVQESIVRWWAEEKGIKGIDNFETLVKNYQRVYAKAEGSKTTSQAIDEMINDALGGLFSTDTGVEQFVQWIQKESGYNQTEQRTIIQRVIDMIDNVVKYLKKVVKDSTLSRAARETAQMEEQRANEIRQMFLDVLEGAIETANTTGEYTTDAETKFRLKGTDENGIEVYETSDETKKLKYSERKALLLNLMKYEFAGRTAKFNKNGQVYYALYDKEGVRKGVYGDNKSDRKGFNAKVNIGADGNYIELAENARYYGTSREQGKKNKFHRDAKTWDYYVKTIKSDGIYFDVLINVKDTGNDQYVYNVQLNENKAALSHAITHLKSKEAASDNIVSDTQENATHEKKFSLREDYDALEERYRNTLRENDTYKTVIDALESRLNIQKGVSVSKESIEKIADKIYRRYKSNYDKADFTDKVAGLFQSGEKNKGNFLYIAEQIMRPVIENSVNNLEVSDYAKGILNDIRKTPIKLDGMQRNEAAYHHGTFNDYRKSLFGRVTFTDKGTSLDTLWKQWSEAYPEWFDESISPVDQPVKLAEIINGLKEDYSNEYGFSLDDAVSYAAMELMNEYANLPEVKNMTDKAASAEFKSQYMKLTNAIKKEYQERYEKQIAELKRENRSKLTSQEAKFRATMSKSRGDRLEAQEKKRYKDSIVKNTKTITRWFEENTDTHHIPEVLRDTTMTFLKSMDFVSENGWNTQDTIQLQNRLNILYRKFSSEESNADGSSIMQDIDPDFLPTMDGLISLLERSQEIKKIGDMDSQQLKEVAYLVGTLKRTITTANKLIGNKQYEKVSQLGDSSVKHMSELKAKKKHGKWIGMGDELLNMHMLDSFSFFKRMGDGAESIHHEIREGFNKRVWKLEEAKTYMKNLIGDTKIKNWTGKHATLHEFNYNGQEFSLTTGQLLNLYVLSKRPQALNHLTAGNGTLSESGGFTIEERSTVKGQKIPERRIKLSEAQMNEIFEKLTPEQKKIADAMQKFLANNCSEWGNEVSMALYGYKKFGEKTYWPIKTNDNFNKTDDRNANTSAGDNTSLYAIRNQGMTKNLVKNANNPIVVGDIFDVFSEHVANMANYNAFVVPLSDAMKWYNYRSRTEEGAVSGSIKEEMERALGTGAKRYFINFIKDVNGEVNKGTASEISDTFTSKYKAAAVGANVRTVVQQPTAYLRAASVMDPKYLAMGFAKKPAVKEMQENSAIAIWKSWGYFETGLGQSMKQVLTGEGTAIEKVVELSMWGTGKADDLAWGALWNAVKAEVADKNKNIDTSSEEYMKLVSERFDEVVDQTQVVDTVLHRSQIMRSQNGIVKMAVAFMSEPTKSYNLLHSAVRNTMERNTPQNRQEVAKRAAVYAITGIATAVAASLVDVFRDDDEEKEWSEKYMEHLVVNVKDNLNPMGMIPYLKEIPSLWEGYDSSRMDMAGISNLVTSVQQAIKFAEGDSTKNLYGVTKGIIRALSQVTGVPMYNTMRDVEALIEQATFAPIDEKELTNAKVRMRLIKALKAGNEKQLKKYLAWYEEKYQEKISEGKSDKDARSSLKTAITSQFKEIYHNSSNAEKIKIKQLLLRISVGGKQLYKDYDWSGWDEKK